MERANLLVSELLRIIDALESENRELRKRLADNVEEEKEKQVVVEEEKKVVEKQVVVEDEKRVVEDRNNIRKVVRGKREREGLEGFECGQCEMFYQITGIKPDKCSKHKMFKPPSDTPDGFWDPW